MKFNTEERRLNKDSLTLCHGNSPLHRGKACVSPIIKGKIFFVVERCEFNLVGASLVLLEDTENFRSIRLMWKCPESKVVSTVSSVVE